MKSMVALLAGLGNGYVDGRERADERARRDKMDQIQLDRAAREGAEFDRIKAERAELQAAGAPVTVQTAPPDPALQDNRDVGMPSERQMSVQGRPMLTQAAADTAATAANTPEAIRQRQMPVLMRQNPAAAAQIQASDLAIQREQADAAAKKWDADIQGVASKGPQAIIDYTNASGASPQQSKFVLDPDGKNGTVHLIGPDGKLTPTGMSYSNDADGARNMTLDLAKHVPIEAKLAHYRSIDEAARRAQADERIEKHQGVMEKISQQSADTASRAQASTSRYHDAMSSAATMRASNAGASGAGKRADHFDEKQWAGAQKIESSFVSVDDESGKAKELPELRQVYRATVNRLRERGDSSPEDASEQARTAVLELRQEAEMDVAAARKLDKKSTLTVHEAIRAINAEYEKSRSNGGKAARKANPADHKDVANAPGGSVVRDAQGNWVNPQPPADRPGVFERLKASPMVRYMSDLGDDYDSPEGKQRLASRVAEAKKGGAPLSDVEKLRATQAGIR